VKEIKAKPGMAVWRRDDEAEQSFSLKLTAAGMKAIAVDDEGDTPSTSTAQPEPTMDEVDNAQTPLSPATSTMAPREGTKMARVLSLLQRDHGATLAELIAATDWLPHTIRAALTGLRKRSYPVTLDRSDKEQGSAYCIPQDHNHAEENAGAVAIEPLPARSARPKKAARPSKPEPAALSSAEAAAYWRPDKKLSARTRRSLAPRHR
jgi:hypothetical protein